jgi:hypothetical protein
VATVNLFLNGLAATATALLLALMRDDIGMPPSLVREDALIGVSVMVAVFVHAQTVGSGCRPPLPGCLKLAALGFLPIFTAANSNTELRKK